MTGRDLDADVAVVGGGPVGLGAALFAVRSGLRTVVLEPRSGAIDKACGEGLMPGAVQALRELGVEPVGQPLRGIRYVAGCRSAEAVFAHGAGRGVRRTTLHEALSTTAAAAAIPVVGERVVSVEQDGGSVVVGGLRARYVLAADGLHSPVRRMLGLDAPVTGARRYGLRCHAQVAPWTDHVEVHWSDAAEAYVTPVGPDQVGIALLTGRRASFPDLLAGFPLVRERLGQAPLSSVRGAGPLRQRSRRRVAGRVLLVGDASGYVDALTGEGIALGIAQARAAVALVAADRPGDYETAWRRVTWRYRLLTAALLGAARFGTVRKAIVPAAAVMPGVFAAAVNELARPA